MKAGGVHKPQVFHQDVVPDIHYKQLRRAEVLATRAKHGVVPPFLPVAVDHSAVGRSAGDGEVADREEVDKVLIRVRSVLGPVSAVLGRSDTAVNLKRYIIQSRGSDSSREIEGLAKVIPPSFRLSFCLVLRV